MPELSVDPRHPSDKAVGLDGAKNCPGVGIDLMNLSLTILPDPQRPFGPRQARITTAAGRRNSGEHLAGPGINLLDAILGDLKQVTAVEGCSCMRGDIDRADCLPARGIEGVQLVSGGEPDVPAVVGDAMHPFCARKGSVLAHGFGS